MANTITAEITVDGWGNLLNELIAAGYDGPALMIHDGSVMQNDDAALDCFVHYQPSNVNTGTLTGADGIPFGPDTGASKIFYLPKGTDLSNVWLFTDPDPVAVKVNIRG